MQQLFSGIIKEQISFMLGTMHLQLKDADNKGHSIGIKSIIHSKVI